MRSLRCVVGSSGDLDRLLRSCGVGFADRLAITEEGAVQRIGSGAEDFDGRCESKQDRRFRRELAILKETFLPGRSAEAMPPSRAENEEEARLRKLVELYEKIVQNSSGLRKDKYQRKICAVLVKLTSLIKHDSDAVSCSGSSSS